MSRISMLHRMYRYRNEERFGWRVLWLLGRLREFRASQALAGMPRSIPQWRLQRRIAALIEQAVAVPLRFAPPARPLVSVVIPVFNNWRLTRACLGSLCLSDTEDIEVIVVDDASSDETAQRLAEVDGLTVLTNEVNAGFTVAANRGAQAARGQLVFFLNNDAIVFADCMGRLVATLRGNGRIGAAGAKLVYPTGLLQEAGAMVSGDALNWNVGQGQRPTKRRYNQRRDVDYCSAAALMVRADVLRSVGYFDVRYSPGYYEDVDLCFSVRAEGFRVVYEPAAVTVHWESMTHGRGTHQQGLPGALARQAVPINRRYFADKWREELSTRPPLHHLVGRITRR